MNTKALFIILLFFSLAISSFATTWQVGASRTYKKPSTVSTLVQNGDTVAIDAGIYNSDTARWAANNLVLKGVGGMALLKANGASYGGKAIWVIAGNNTTVQYIEFSLCSCPSQNGAGIRQEGINLTVQHCYFHDNEDGILAGDNTTSDIIIEYSEFYNNGFGDGYSHNLYINHVNSLTFRYNYSHHAKIGHELKSRAYNNYILYNRLANEATGTASRNIDLPNGGLAIIIGNEIHQGTQTQNSNMVGYGLEGLTNTTPHQLYFINNTLVNERSTAIFVMVQNGTTLCKMYNNIFAGNGTVLSGTSTTLDTTRNYYCAITATGLVNASAYDYHLLSTANAVNKGITPGFAGTFNLKPVFEYNHPTASNARAQNDSIDIGAHEFGAGVGMNLMEAKQISMNVFPNPSSGNYKILLTGFSYEQKRIQLIDLTGKVIFDLTTNENEIAACQHLLSGLYFLNVEANGVRLSKSILIKND